MDFELTNEQRAIRETCRDFAREVVAPAAEELDRHHKFGYDIIRQMGELGLFGLPFAEQYGGAGGDHLSLCIAIEEISRGDAGVGITLEAAVCLGAAPIYEFGTREQKERWLPDLMAGRTLWSFGLTEPEATILTQLGPGQALWQVGRRSFVVQHYRSRLEAQLTNTDTGMRVSEARIGRG